MGGAPVIEAVAGDDVEVEFIDGIGPPVGTEFTVVKGHERCAVEERGVAAGGCEGGDDSLHVLLIEFARMSTQVADAFFV
jgi:hypothetical protein